VNVWVLADRLLRRLLVFVQQFFRFDYGMAFKIQVAGRWSTAGAVQDCRRLWLSTRSIRMQSGFALAAIASCRFRPARPECRRGGRERAQAPADRLDIPVPAFGRRAINTQEHCGKSTPSVRSESLQITLICRIGTLRLQRIAHTHRSHRRETRPARPPRRTAGRPPPHGRRPGRNTASAGRRRSRATPTRSGCYAIGVDSRLQLAGRVVSADAMQMRQVNSRLRSKSAERNQPSVCDGVQNRILERHDLEYRVLVSAGTRFFFASSTSVRWPSGPTA